MWKKEIVTQDTRIYKVNSVIASNDGEVGGASFFVLGAQLGLLSRTYVDSYQQRETWPPCELIGLVSDGQGNHLCRQPLKKNQTTGKEKQRRDSNEEEEECRKWPMSTEQLCRALNEDEICTDSDEEENMHQIENNAPIINELYKATEEAKRGVDIIEEEKRAGQKATKKRTTYGQRTRKKRRRDGPRI